MTSSKTPPAKTLHFTLGPVQGFIADARRVRDLWAGSFLLSWLSGQAMVALEKAGWEIEYPMVDGDALFEAISKGKKCANPYIGSLPNRFKAKLSAVELETLPQGTADAGALCGQVIKAKWIELANTVWDQFLTDDVTTLGNGGKDAVRAIWDRQVNNFWDINWVIGDDPQDGTDGQWLDQRKNWRSHFPVDQNGKALVEDGDLCRLMGRYQEVSGFHRIGGKSGQKTFWDKLRQQTYTHPRTGKPTRLLNLNIGDDERLCALALIKRLFPLIAEKAIGWQPGGSAGGGGGETSAATDGGGENLSIINWPSVSYIAAVPWLKEVETSLDESAWSAFWNEVNDNLDPGFMGETETRLFGLPRNGLFKLDGHLLHEDGITAWPSDGFKTGSESVRRTTLLNGLKKIESQTDAKASEFYAVLQMDGDNIGAQVRDYFGTVKEGLAKFTEEVRKYFDPDETGKNPSNGVLIYAGGDDVLALLPLERAIVAAVDLQQKYEEAFKLAILKNPDEKSGIANFTMSASIIYAQYKIPLSAVLKKSHHYLDKIAKDHNGRSSLAIAVMKPGGIAYDWVSCWDGSEGEPIASLLEVASDRADFSASFFYNIRERYAPLFVDSEQDEDTSNFHVSAEFADPEFMKSVLVAEYKKQRGKAKLNFIEAREKTKPLMAIGQPLKRMEISSGGWQTDPVKNYHFDGALVAHFLGVEGNGHNGPKSKGKNNAGDEQ